MPRRNTEQPDEQPAEQLDVSGPDQEPGSVTVDGAEQPAAPAPSLGRVVLVLGDVACHNGADVAPGIVTRVHGEHPDGGHSINVTVLPDGYMPRHATSVRLFADEQAAREALTGHRGGVAAYWPPRV